MIPPLLKIAVFAATLALGVAPGQAQIAAEHPRNCVMDVGPTQMMFSALQGGRSDEIFCQNIPEPGPTDFIFDARQPELRDMDIDVRLLRDVGQKDWRDDLDANTVAFIPARKYLAERGTASFHIDLDRNGDYMAIVRAMGDDKREYVGEFRFSVGGFGMWRVVFVALSVLVVALGYGLWRRGSRGATAASITR